MNPINLWPLGQVGGFCFSWTHYKYTAILKYLKQKQSYLLDLLSERQVQVAD